MATATAIRHDSLDAHLSRQISPDELESLTGINGAEVERQVVGAEIIGMPQGARTLADIEAEQRREARESHEQRIADLRSQLESQRSDLVAIAGLRAGRFGSRKNGAVRSLYEARLATHNKTFVELTKLEHPDWELTGQETLEEATHKQQAATMHYVEHLGALRTETSKELKSTRIGKVVEFFNRGGRLKKFIKFAGIGIAAGALGALTGGLAGGAIAAGIVGGAARFGRGFIRAEGGSRDVGLGKEADDHDIFRQALSYVGSKLSLADAGAAAMASIFTGDIKDQQKKRRRSLTRGVAYTALGATIGGAMHLVHEAVASADPVPATPDHPVPGPAAPDLLEKFQYHVERNPFFKPTDGIGGPDTKVGMHDMGPPLQANPQLDGAYPAGWNDLTQNRWVESPEQFASVCTAFGIDGMPDDFDTINGLAEQFKLNPGSYKEKYDAVMSIIHQPTTTVTTEPITGPIRTEFGKIVGPGNMDRYWDDWVDNPIRGTKTVITFKDPTTGAMRTLELRDQCGGQRMIELPKPVYVPEETYTPQGGGYVPQDHPTYTDTPRGGGDVPTHDQPQPEQPQGGGDIPSVPDTPIAPALPPVTPSQPTPDTGLADKTGPWKAPGDDNKTDSGIGSIPFFSPGLLAPAPHVDTAVPHDNGITSTPHNSLGSEAGVTAPHATTPKPIVPGRVGAAPGGGTNVKPGNANPF